MCIGGLLTLGMHAEEGYGTCLVCLSVCLSVTTLAATSFFLTLEVRCLGVYYRLFLDFNSIKPSVQKLWREKANNYLLTTTSYGSDAARIFEDTAFSGSFKV